MSILSEEEYVLTDKLQVKDFTFSLPLFGPSHSSANDNIQVFARGVRTYDAKFPQKPWSDPWIVFLQGGPGFECAPPSRSGSMAFLLDKGYQVLLLDQRGTGMSSALGCSDIEKGDVEKLAQFRADAIVRDCEAIRALLIGEQKWSILGQSFGGFVATTYLSFAQHGLKEVFTTGGMPPLISSQAELLEVYQNLHEKVASRNQVYYEKYPKDVSRVHTILRHLHRNSYLTPNGGSLTPRRFLTLGFGFGMHGGIDNVHFLVQRAAAEIENLGKLTAHTLNRLQAAASWEWNPIYAVLHEACYCNGFTAEWAAANAPCDEKFSLDFLQRIPKDDADIKAGAELRPVYFTGEMIFPWFFDDFAELRQVKDKMSQLTRYNGWSKLYDAEQLKRNSVPVYSAIYIEDMYVSYSHAEKTASAIGNHKTFVTNVLFHDALRSKTDEVLGTLFKLKESIAD